VLFRFVSLIAFRSTHVPVGEDQQQHIEFARAVAGSFNHTYGEVFTIPEPLICNSLPSHPTLAAIILTTIAAPARRIMSLTDPGKKMSKSDPNPNSRVLITDDEETIRRKFRTAFTDSIEGISYDPENRPGVSNLLDILKHTRDEEISSHDLAADFKDSSLRSLKEAVADAVAESVGEVRERFLELRSSPESLHYNMGRNQLRASTAANKTLKEVQDVMGMGRLYLSFNKHQPYTFKPVEE
jgi:tryptophanyl-tRNA synthetase